jgi:hypothetical protein
MKRTSETQNSTPAKRHCGVSLSDEVKDEKDKLQLLEPNLIEKKQEDKQVVVPEAAVYAYVTYMDIHNWKATDPWKKSCYKQWVVLQKNASFKVETEERRGGSVSKPSNPIYFETQTVHKEISSYLYKGYYNAIGTDKVETYIAAVVKGKAFGVYCENHTSLIFPVSSTVLSIEPLTADEWLNENITLIDANVWALAWRISEDFAISRSQWPSRLVLKRTSYADFVVEEEFLKNWDYVENMFKRAKRFVWSRIKDIQKVNRRRMGIRIA